MSESTGNTKSLRVRLKKSINIETPVTKSTKSIASSEKSTNYSDHELRMLFMNSMSLKHEENSPSNKAGKENKPKRLNDTPTSSSSVGPKKKKLRTEECFSVACSSLSISPKNFYSSSQTFKKSKEINRCKENKSLTPFSIKCLKPKNVVFINKGVRHKIKKKIKSPKSLSNDKNTSSNILKNIHNEKLRCLLKSSQLEKEQMEDLHIIYNNGNNPIEMAKPLNFIIGTMGLTQSWNNIDTLNGSRSKTGDTVEFSDLECSSESEDLNENFPMLKSPASRLSLNSLSNTYQSETKKRIFRSGCSTTTKKEIQITKGIRAIYLNGKICIVPDKKKHKKSEISKTKTTVSKILKDLEESSNTENESLSLKNEISNVRSVLDVDDIQTKTLSISKDSISNNRDQNSNYSEFYRRIPFKTTDPKIIEKQYLLLDFLLSNKICTEKNYTIFIADPENHKKEAAKIVDRVKMAVNRQSRFRNRIPYEANDPLLKRQQEGFLDFSIENEICTEENFNIFIADYENRQNEAEVILYNTLTQKKKLDIFWQAKIHPPENILDEIRRAEEAVEEIPIVENFKRTKPFPIFYPAKCQSILKQSNKKKRFWRAGQGANQYQIDAGQKDFGPRQCENCGLVYTVHESEEEKLHEEFHKSMHVLRFKGWSNENVIATYVHWGSDGRIVRMSNHSPPKYKERLKEVLQVVDKELGFSSSILPTTFVAYLAIGNKQIIGLCLVEPLKRANKFFSVDGIDCCTEESYESKCGVSRIWVSNFYRRSQIATNLMHAVRTHTVPGEEIQLNKIAFSTPTSDGKNFAQKITKMENFLVYQSINGSD